LVTGVALTVVGVLLRDRSASGNNIAAESIRNAGIAVVGGVTVGALLSLVQRALNKDLAAQAALTEHRRSLDLVIATRQDLKTIDLSRVDLRRRYLAGKDLSHAQLGDADLRGTNLRGAILQEAQLVGTNLTGADLTGADLTGADLTGADLTGAELTGADLTDALSDSTTRWPAAMTRPAAVTRPPPAPSAVGRDGPLDHGERRS
jgi:uncharacterized protein YjbI with pentapeptide repeats